MCSNAQHASAWRPEVPGAARCPPQVGVLNKMGTIAFTAIAFPGDSSTLGKLALATCILFGLLYQDAPMRRGVGSRPEMAMKV